MAGKKVRWGILSTAEIGRKNWKAIRNSGNATVVAVASRDAAKSAQYIVQCQNASPMEAPPMAYGSYEALLASPEVDAVYIPLPTGLRKEWVMRAAAAGKHVLCEKPCAVSLADLQEMVAACRKHGVQFMDGVMFMHSKRLDQLREVLDDANSMGNLKRISSAFSFCGPEKFFTSNIRTNGALEPAGCLGDLGWYCIRFALWVMKEQLPVRVTGRILSQSGGRDGVASVPSEFSGELFFKDGVSSSFYCSFITEIEQWAIVSGTKGNLRLSDFVVPFFGAETGFEINHPVHWQSGCDFNMEAHWERKAVPEYSSGHPTSQETNMFRNFSELVLQNRVDDSLPAIASNTQQVMDACFRSAQENREVVLG